MFTEPSVFHFLGWLLAIQVVVIVALAGFHILRWVVKSAFGPKEDPPNDKT